MLTALPDLPPAAVCDATSRFAALGKLIGNTPLLGLQVAVEGCSFRVFAKCEWKNLTGSIKDRMALYILRQAYATGALRPGGRIVEATSGNTGISFAALGRALGHSVTIFMPDWMSIERVRLLKSYGAEVRLVSKAEGGFLGSIAMAEEMAASSPAVFLPRQFSNQTNVEAHRLGTGPELWGQMAALDLRPDAFVAGVGTGGTVMGVGACLREHDASIRIHPLEPAESPTLSTGVKVGHHRIQGISDEFIPEIVHLDSRDEVIAVSAGDAIRMAQRLAAGFGLGVGISSGANLLGAIKAAMMLGDGAVVATVFADDNKKYLSTDLLREEPTSPRHLAPLVEFESIAVV